jgi:hypothetical protein
LGITIKPTAKQQWFYCQEIIIHPKYKITLPTGAYCPTVDYDKQFNSLKLSIAILAVASRARHSAMLPLNTVGN